MKSFVNRMRSLNDVPLSLLPSTRFDILRCLSADLNRSGDYALVVNRCALPVFSGPALAESSHIATSVNDLTAPDDTAAINAVAFYPTTAPETSLHVGPFTIEASRDAAPMMDKRFPVELISHGRRGSPLSHRELAIALTRAGFIVILPTHVGTRQVFPWLRRNRKS
jgi:hypothetical protein